MSKLISIVMPAFNAEKTIKASIESVLNQSYENWELIICDDGSSDGTLDIVGNFNDNRITTICNRYSKGAAGARNSCIEIASGEYLAFLDSDDLWSSEKLLTQINFMLENEVDFSYGSYLIITDSSSDVNGIFNPPEKIENKTLLKSCDIGCLTVMLKTSSYPDFCFPYVGKEDYAAWITCSQKGFVMRKYPGTHAYYRVSSNSLSSNKYKEISKQFRVIRKFGKLNILKASYYMLFYIFRGVIKHKLKYKYLNN
ncbi:glycosyltransferase family 2 protein [Vibrio parahaemolyticus]